MLCRLQDAAASMPTKPPPLFCCRLLQDNTKGFIGLISRTMNNLGRIRWPENQHDQHEVSPELWMGCRIQEPEQTVTCNLNPRIYGTPATSPGKHPTPHTFPAPPKLLTSSWNTSKRGRYESYRRLGMSLRVQGLKYKVFTQIHHYDS